MRKRIYFKNRALTIQILNEMQILKYKVTNDTS